MKIAFTHGTLLDRDFQWQTFENILIEDGKIRAINGDITPAHQVYDARQHYLLPGLIDLSVALREPGYTAKGSIASETAAAAAGGVTTLCATPDSHPVNDTKAVTKLIAELSEHGGRCKVLPLGALTAGLNGEHLAEYAALKNAGCVGLSNSFTPIKSLAITKRCFEYAKTHDMTVFINPIEPSLHVGVMHEGEISTTIGLQGISSLAESLAVGHLIQLARATGVSLHLSQLSCAESVSLVRQAKASGQTLTADVALQNLLYTDLDVEYFNNAYHCEPPLRSEADRLALLVGVRDGTIDAITSCHRPHEAAAKQMPFAESAPGISMLELLLPCALQLDRRGELPLADFVRAMTSGPAKILGCYAAPIAVDEVADLSLFNPELNWKVQDSSLISEGKNTPLLGETIAGGVMLTLCRGQLSYQRE